MAFTKETGSNDLVRLRVEVDDNGALSHDYGHGVTVSCRAGWNDGCPMVANYMSVDELRDLRYLIDRALAYADRGRGRAASVRAA